MERGLSANVLATDDDVDDVDVVVDRDADGDRHSDDGDRQSDDGEGDVRQLGDDG